MRCFCIKRKNPIINQTVRPSQNPNTQNNSNIFQIAQPQNNTPFFQNTNPHATQATNRTQHPNLTKPRAWNTRNKLRCIFCGGQSCFVQSWSKHPNATAIHGLNSNWITERILATQRLSSRIIEQYQIIAQFKQQKIKAVFNLQLPGEHPYCGDGLRPESGFSYLPEQLEKEGISFYNWGWKDMNIPTFEQMVNTVQLMSFVTDQGWNFAVHCHAGYGRTGIAIACFLIYSENLSAENAIRIVRKERPKCIQKNRQAEFCYEFQKFIRDSKQVFPKKPLELKQFIQYQNVWLHGERARNLLNQPKILVVVSGALRDAVSVVQSKIFLSSAFYNLEFEGFQTEKYIKHLPLLESAASFDGTVPERTGLEIEEKIKIYKLLLNWASWSELEKEKDLRVLIQLVLDWLQQHLLTPILDQTCNIDSIKEQITQQPFPSYSENLSQYLNRIQFKSLQWICQGILNQVLDLPDSKICLIRFGIAVLGVKEQFLQYFQQRNLSGDVVNVFQEEYRSLIELMEHWSRFKLIKQECKLMSQKNHLNFSGLLVEKLWKIKAKKRKNRR